MPRQAGLNVAPRAVLVSFLLFPPALGISHTQLRKEGAPSLDSSQFPQTSEQPAHSSLLGPASLLGTATPKRGSSSSVSEVAALVEQSPARERDYQRGRLFNGLLTDVVVGAKGVWTVWRGDDPVQSAAPYVAPTGANEGTSALETAKERVLEEQKNLCDWTESHARAGYGFDQDQSFQICTSKESDVVGDVVKRERYGWYDCNALPNLFQKNLPAGGKGGKMKWFILKSSESRF